MLLKNPRLFFRRLIFGPHPITDYLAISVPPYLDSRAHWQVGSQGLDVRTAFIMYDPPLVAIDLEEQVLSEEAQQTPSKLTFLDLDQQVELGTMVLEAKARVELDNGAFLVYRIVDSELVVGSLRARLVNRVLYRRLKKDHRSFLSYFSPTVYRIISNFFLHPRGVRLLTMRTQDDSMLHFPLDLFIHSSGHAYFGLRKTNKAVGQLKEGIHLCLSDVVAEYRGVIYRLGKFGGDDKEAPQMVESVKLNLSIPAVFNYYLELETVEVFPFEHQTLFRARVINEFRVKTPRPVLAHIQNLRYTRCPPSYQHGLI